MKDMCGIKEFCQTNLNYPPLHMENPVLIVVVEQTSFSSIYSRSVLG